MSSNGTHYQLPRLRDFARRLHLGSARPRSASPLGLRLVRTRTLNGNGNGGHYRDHIIPLPSSPSISPVPSRLQPQAQLAPVPHVCAQLAPVPHVCAQLQPGPHTLRLDLSARVLPQLDAPSTSMMNAAATFPACARLRIVCAHLPGPLLVESTHPYGPIAGSLLLAPVLTPAMLLGALHRALHDTRVTPREWLSTSADKRARVQAACARRLGHPGGQVAWIDFLEHKVIFAGLTRDPAVLRRVNPAGCLEPEDEYTWVLHVEPREYY